MCAEAAFKCSFICSRISAIFFKETSGLNKWSSSTKRLMCVPLYLSGRSTYMFIEAIVCWKPFFRSRTVMGYRRSFIPTLSTGILRKSCWFWISFIGLRFRVQGSGFRVQRLITLQFFFIFLLLSSVQARFLPARASQWQARPYHKNLINSTLDSDQFNLEPLNREPLFYFNK